MKSSFVFSGSGGQGIMSAGIMLAHTAIDMGSTPLICPSTVPNSAEAAQNVPS